MLIPPPPALGVNTTASSPAPLPTFIERRSECPGSHQNMPLCVPHIKLGTRLPPRPTKRPARIAPAPINSTCDTDLDCETRSAGVAQPAHDSSCHEGQARFSPAAVSLQDLVIPHRPPPVEGASCTSNLQASGTVPESIFGGNGMSSVMPDSEAPMGHNPSVPATAARDRISELQDILVAAARAPIVRPSKLPRTVGAVDNAPATHLVSSENEAETAEGRAVGLDREHRSGSVLSEQQDQMRVVAGSGHDVSPRFPVPLRIQDAVLTMRRSRAQAAIVRTVSRIVRTVSGLSSSRINTNLCGVERTGCQTSISHKIHQPPSLKTMHAITLPCTLSHDLLLPPPLLLPFAPAPGFRRTAPAFLLGLPFAGTSLRF